MRRAGGRRIPVIILAAVLVLGFPLLFGPDAAGAQEADGRITMSVTYGYYNQARYGRYFNVYVTLANYGSDYEGTLRAVLSTGEPDTTEYEVEVELETGGRQEYTLPVAAYTEITGITVTLEEKGGREETECSIVPNIINYGENCVIGVLSSEGNYDYLEYLGGKVIRLDAQTLPENLYGYDMFDMVILDCVDSSLITEEAKTALIQWTLRGGTLLFGTGSYGLASYEGFREAFGEASVAEAKEILLDYGLTAKEEYTRLCSAITAFEDSRSDQIVSMNAILDGSLQQNRTDDATGDTGESREDNGLAAVLYGNYVPASVLADKEIGDFLVLAPYVLVNRIVYEGSSGLQEQEGMPLLYRKECGQGTVVIAAIEIGTGSRVRTEDNLIWYAQGTMLKNQLNDRRKSQLSSELYGNSGDYWLYDSAAYVDDSKMPQSGRYALVLGCYVLLAGPVLYLILRKKDRCIYLWWMIPLGAVAVTLIVYGMGSSTRIDGSYVSYVNLIQYDSMDQAQGTVYFSVMVPSSRNEETALSSGAEVVEIRQGMIPSYYYTGLNYEENQSGYPDSTSYNNVTVLQDGFTGLTLNMYPAFTRAYYMSVYQTESGTDLVEGAQSVGPVLTADGLTGSVTNRTVYHLTDVIFLGDQFLSYVGELESGESAALDAEQTLFLGTRDLVSTNQILERISQETGTVSQMEAVRRYNLLQYFLERHVFRTNQSWLIGFTNEAGSGNPLQDSLEDGNVSGLTMIALPVEIDYTDGNREYVPIIDVYMEILDGEYDNSYYYRSLDSDILTVEYHLPAEDRITSVLYTSVMNPEYSKKTLDGFTGDVYFLNRITGRYDLVFSDNIPGRVSNMDAYLDENNTLIVEYRKEPAYSSRYMTLPYLSYEKEVSYD